MAKNNFLLKVHFLRLLMQWFQMCSLEMFEFKKMPFQFIFQSNVEVNLCDIQGGIYWEYKTTTIFY